MEDQKITNLFDNTPNQPFKFIAKYWVKIKDYLRGMYKKNSQNRPKTSILKSGLCDYSDAYIHVSGTITIAVERADDYKKGEKKKERSNNLKIVHCSMII